MRGGQALRSARIAADTTRNKRCFSSINILSIVCLSCRRPCVKVNAVNVHQLAIHCFAIKLGREGISAGAKCISRVNLTLLRARLDISGFQALRHQSEVLAKAEGQLAEGVRVNRENIEEMQASPRNVPPNSKKKQLHETSVWSTVAIFWWNTSLTFTLRTCYHFRKMSRASGGPFSDWKTVIPELRIRFPIA